MAEIVLYGFQIIPILEGQNRKRAAEHVRRDMIFYTGQPTVFIDNGSNYWVERGFRDLLTKNASACSMASLQFSR